MKMMNQKKKGKPIKTVLIKAKRTQRKQKRQTGRSTQVKRKAQTKMRLRKKEKNKSRKLRKERRKKKRKRERQSNSSRKSNFLLFKNSIKALVNISHRLMRNYLIVTMSISLSVWMRVLLTANMKRVCTQPANDPEKGVELQPLDHRNQLTLTVPGRHHRLLQTEVFNHHLITTPNRGSHLQPTFSAHHHRVSILVEDRCFL